jgi:hypothetical protein
VTGRRDLQSSNGAITRSMGHDIADYINGQRIGDFLGVQRKILRESTGARRQLS